MQNRYKLWIVLSLVVAFGAGLLGGVISQRYYFQKLGAGRRGGPHFPSLEQMSRELGLSADQQASIKTIFVDNDVRLKAFRTEVHSRLDVIRADLKGKIDAVLTAEQKTKLEARIAKYVGQGKDEADKKKPGSDKDRSQDKPTGETK